MQFNRFKKELSLRELAKLADEDNEEMMDAIFAAESTQNEKTLSRLREYLMLKAKPQIDEPDPYHPYPKPSELMGDLEMGMTKNAVCRIDPNILCKNMLSAGIVGAGKTTHAFGLMAKLSRLGVKILSLGVKRDVRHMAYKELPMLVLRFCGKPNVSLGNIFDAPENVDETDYLIAVINLIAQTMFIAEAGQSLLLETAITAKAQHGYVNFPILIDRLKKIRIWSKRMADWVSTCLNRFNALNLTFGAMISDQKPFPFEKTCEKFHMELELDGAGMYKPFFAAYPWLRIFKYRIANNVRGNRLLTAVFCDEVNVLASKILERHAAALGIQLVLLEYAPLSREFGIGFVVYSNQPSEVSDVLKAQSGIKMAMRLGNWTDIRDMGNSMVLNDEQMKVIPDLPLGRAIIRLPGINPFPIEIPDFPIVKDVTDEQVDGNNLRILKNSEWEKYLMPNMTANSHAIVLSSMAEPRKDDQVRRSFLHDVYNRPYIGLTERYRSLNLSMSQGDALYNSLSKQGFILVHAINLNGRGNSTKFLELTELGYADIDMTPRKSLGRGAGFLHELIQVKIYEHVKNMSEVKSASIEGMIQNKAIDVLVELTDHTKIGIEVAMTSQNELNNAKKNLSVGCACVIVVAKDKAIAKNVVEKFNTAGMLDSDRITVCLVYQVLKCKGMEDILSLTK
jgi:hypothetical protein